MFHFGYDDDSEGYSYSEWRGRWVTQGMRYGFEGKTPPDGWQPVSQLMTLLARGEPELILFTGSPGLDDTDRRAAFAGPSVKGLTRLSRAWRQRPGDLGLPIRVYVAHVESTVGAGTVTDAIDAALSHAKNSPYIVEVIVAGQEQSRYRQLLIERGVVLYSR
jgi:hypothetical protein